MSEHRHTTILRPEQASTAKRGALFGGAATGEALASSRTVLGRPRGTKSSFTGLQQWFSPPQAAELIAAVLGRQEAVLDPTAGSGALLAPFSGKARYGIEIDADHARGASYEAIAGDAQAVVPMLRAAGLKFPAVVINPPFGLSWRDPLHAPDGKPGAEINSTVLAYLWAHDLLTRHGQGAMICGAERLQKAIMGREEARGIYAVVEVDGPLFDGVALPTAIAFFVHHTNLRTVPTPAPTPGGPDLPDGPRLFLRAAREALPSLAPRITAARERAAYHVTPYLPGEALPRLREGFRAVTIEHSRRRRRAAVGDRAGSRHDLSLRGNKLSVHLSAYAKLALAREGILREIELLSGQHTSYFAQNSRVWKTVEEAAQKGLVSVEPALAGKVAKVREGAALLSTPLFEVKPQMRLGWLADLDRIRCVKSDPERGYEAGEDYPLSTRSRIASESHRRVVEKRNGEHELRRFVTERRLLRITIGEHSFDESAANISYLTTHFEMPDPGSVASRYPELVERNRRLLEEIEAEIRPRYDAFMRGQAKLGETGFEPFSFKNFQLDHLSRLLVKGRGMLAHEQGLGKGLQQMVLAEAIPRLPGGAKRQALFVVPQDLIPQMQREARKYFGRTMEEIRTPQQARDVARRVKAGEEGWWITYYEALSVVGRKKEVLPHRPLDHRMALARRLMDYKKSKGLPTRVPEFLTEGSTATTAAACPSCNTDTSYGWSGEVCRRCGYVHRSVYVKSAYSHLTTAFERGVKCIDEVSEIRGDDSLRSKAVRALARGAHNFGATGTPLSNYVNDAFWGLWFCLGNASAAFPYDYANGKSRFEADFCVIEYLMGREDDGEDHLRKRRKVLPQVTNVSQFWRLVQPGVSRCRKEQTGEPLVARTFYPIRVPMGVAQQKAHLFWLKRFADYFIWKYPDHPMATRELAERWAAALGQLWRLEGAATLPASDEPSGEWPEGRQELGELSNWTPANLKVLELAINHAANGEKVLIGSDLIMTGKWLAERLCQKGVRAVHITEEKGKGAQRTVGTKNPRKRATEVRAFVEGDAQVLCAGVAALKLGHNLDVASCVIVHGLPYSHMAMDQFLARVHRLTSKREVSVYTVIPRESLAERKWGLLKDKGAASDLAFDGELFVEPEKPVDWAKVLREMKARGIATGLSGDEVPEADVEAAWRKMAPLAFLTPDQRTSGAPRRLPPAQEAAGTTGQPRLPLTGAMTAGGEDLFALFDDDERSPRRYIQTSLF